MIQLQIETIASCNAKCVFCTYPTMKRKRGRMSTDLYTKILEDAQPLSMFIDRTSLQGLGEPLLDIDIVWRVERMKAAFPHAELSLYTNGSYLTKAKSQELHDAGLDLLVISLSAANATQRKATMGLDDYDRVVEFAEEARTIIPRTKVKLVFNRDLLGIGDDQEFVKRWGDNAFVTFEGNWANRLTKFRGAPHTTACRRALDQLMVLWNGDVALCCFDGEGEMTFGNAADTSVAEIWSGAARQRVRELHEAGKRAEIDLCRNCTGI